MNRTKNIIIVNDGRWGQVTRKEYDDFVDVLKLLLKDEDRARVEAVHSLKAALQKVKEEKVHVLIFITRGILAEVRKAQEKNPELRSVKKILLTGLAPEEEIILASKGWQPETIRDIIMN